MKNEINFDIANVVNRLKTERDQKNVLVVEAQTRGKKDAGDVIASIDYTKFCKLCSFINDDDYEDDEYADFDNLKDIVFGNDLNKKLYFANDIRAPYKREIEKIWIATFLKWLKKYATMIADGMKKP